MSDYQKEYYKKNKEKILFRTKKYYQKNKDKYKKLSSNYYQRNKEELLETHKNYNKQNIATIREWERSYHKTPAGYFRHLKKKAKMRGKGFNITKQEFIDWISTKNNTCCYCNSDLIYDIKAGTSPSVDRKNNNLGYTLNNICLCCTMCNKVKNEFFTYEEMLVIGQTIKNIIINRK